MQFQEPQHFFIIWRQSSSVVERSFHKRVVMGSIPIFGTLWIRSEIGYRASLSRRRLPVRVRSGPQLRQAPRACFILTKKLFYCIKWVEAEMIVLLIAGWSGNSPQYNFAVLRRELSKIPGVKVYSPDYLEKKGKLNTKESIEDCANRVEKYFLSIKKDFPEEPIVAMGHSLGALIIRILIKRGHVFEDAIFAGGPHKGISKKFILLYPLAYVLGIKMFFELLPWSNFLEELGKPPEGIYIASSKDEVVPRNSAFPPGAKRGYVVSSCGHNMFPREEEKVPQSVIPIVVAIIKGHMQQA